MKTVIVVIPLAVLFLAAGCSSSGPPVGAGGNFTVFSTQPTGSDFSRVLYAATRYLPSLSKADLRTKRTMALFGHALIPAAFAGPTGSFTHQGSKSCPGGGTIPWTDSETSTATGGSVEGQANFNNCAVVLTFGSQSLNETLTGSVTGSSTFSNTGQMTVHEMVSISGSGDVGFSVNCDLTGSAQFGGSQLANPTSSGQCTFKDAAGTKIEAASADVQDLIFF